jgi:hypothetical protein
MALVRSEEGGWLSVANRWEAPSGRTAGVASAASARLTSVT